MDPLSSRNRSREKSRLQPHGVSVRRTESDFRGRDMETNDMPFRAFERELSGRHYSHHGIGLEYTAGFMEVGFRARKRPDLPGELNIKCQTIMVPR
jgi:hypothetical protein